MIKEQEDKGQFHSLQNSSTESTNVVQMYEDVVEWFASKNDNSTMTVTSFRF